MPVVPYWSFPYSYPIMYKMHHTCHAQMPYSKAEEEKNADILLCDVPFAHFVLYFATFSVHIMLYREIS
jgi:hypothetical protein